MTTKEKVWLALNKNAGNYVSGQDLSEKLGISRSAIWKAIESLRDDGITVDARTNRGYALIPNGQILAKVLEKLLPGQEIHCHETIDSTNREAKELAAAGAPDGTLSISEKQTGGRGRLGRSFSSPRGGIYLSLVLRPQVHPESSLLITSAAAVATAEAISEVCGIDCGIKWVNDLYYQGRKVVGILTEGVVDVETGRLSAVVPGIGINFCTQKHDFPVAIRETAGSLFSGPSQVPQGVDQNVLAAVLVRRLCHYSRNLESRVFLPAYRKRNILLGREVNLIRSDAVWGTGVVEDIDDDARLIVRMPDGKTTAVGTGEVTVRLARPRSGTR